MPYTKDVPYQNAYSYLVTERQVQPRVVEDAMLGAIPSGGYDVISKFQPVIEALQAKPSAPPKARGRPPKSPAPTPKDRLQWLTDVRDKLQQCLLKHAGWLCFFYCDPSHRITAIRFRAPYTKQFMF